MFQRADCRDIKGDEDIKGATQTDGQGKRDGEQEDGELDMGPGSGCGVGCVMHGRHMKRIFIYMERYETMSVPPLAIVSER